MVSNQLTNQIDRNRGRWMSKHGYEIYNDGYDNDASEWRSVFDLF